MDAFSKLIAVLAAVSVAAAATPLSPGTGLPTYAPVDAVATDFHVDLGDLLTGLQRFGAARQAYAEAVRVDRAMGGLPVEGLRRIANAYYFEGDYQAAAVTLADLAGEAASFGDGAAQVWALADAAWLAGLVGDRPAVEGYRDQLERLCVADDSLLPHCQIVTDGLMAELSVFAPHLASW